MDIEECHSEWQIWKLLGNGKQSWSLYATAISKQDATSSQKQLLLKHNILLPVARASKQV